MIAIIMITRIAMLIYVQMKNSLSIWLGLKGTPESVMGMKIEEKVIRAMEEAKKWRRWAREMMAEIGMECLGRNMVSLAGASSCASRAKVVTVWVSIVEEISRYIVIVRDVEREQKLTSIKPAPIFRYDGAGNCHDKLGTKTVAVEEAIEGRI
jgi:hypothetical protein